MNGDMGTPGRKPKATPEDVLAVFTDREDRAAPLTSSEVADAVGVSRPQAWKKLDTLATEGVLRRKSVGARAVVWWVPLTATETEVEEALNPSSENRKQREYRKTTTHNDI